MRNRGNSRKQTAVLVPAVFIILLLLTGQIWWASQLSNNPVSLVQPTAEGQTAVQTIPTLPSIGESASSAVAASLNAPSITGLPVVSDNSLVPLPNPRTYQAQLPNHNFQVHVVQRGETPNIIADQYGISAETLLGGNPWLNQESNQLQTGAELVILPVDGVLHTVQPGETLEQIADTYDILAETIAAYESNNIEAPFNRLVPESELLIPGASVGQFYWTAPKSVAGAGGNQAWEIIGTGSFIWPVNGRCLTQYYWFGHPGIDVGLPEGSPVYAADQGTVTYAAWAAGSYYDYGNLIVINHGNGYETLYAHLSSIGVYPGQIVYKGDVIGGTGNTGRSSGPHIHFEIRLNDFRDDPLFYLGGAQNCT